MKGKMTLIFALIMIQFTVGSYAQGVVPLLSSMAQDIKVTDPSTLSLIVTVPALVMIFSSFLPGILSQKVGFKNIVIIGTIIALIGGLGPILTNDFIVILVFRGILGLGAGMILPTTGGILANNIEGKSRDTAIGIVTASAGVWAMVASIVAGMLATIGWKTAFGTYGFTAIALIVFLICVNKQPLKEINLQSEETKTKKSKIPPVVFLWGLGAVFIMATSFVVLNVFSQLIIGQKIGTVSDVGFLSALVAVGTMTASFLFGFLFRAFKKFILTVALTCIGFGFFVISNATGLPMITLGILAVGLGLGMVNPTLMSYAIKASPESPTLATSIICSGLFLGQFLSSVSINIIMAVTNSQSLNSLVFSTGVVIAIGVVVALIFAIRKKNEIQTAAETQ